MIKEYGIQKYWFDINLLETLVIKSQENTEENGVFQYINELAGFLGEYEGDKQVAYFSELVDETAEIIEWCNSKQYDYLLLQEKIQKLKDTLNKFKNKFKEHYPIHIYFKGIDNYNIFDCLSKSYICLYTDYDCFINYCKQSEFHLLITDDTTSKALSNFDQIISCKEICEHIRVLISKKYYQNYDFNYLKYALKASVKQDIETLIVGCSYPMNGIQTNLLQSKAVNLSLPSQDIYYSLKLVQHVLEQTRNISRIILGTGIWSLHFDLSQSLNSEVKRIENVYFPLLQDAHHYSYNLEHNKIDYNSFEDEEFRYYIVRLFNIEKLDQNIHSQIFQQNQNTYFNENIKREYFSQIGTQKLSQLNMDEKHDIGRQRAFSHNKLYNYQETAKENYYLLKRLLEYTTSKDIEVCIINFPHTTYYYNHISRDMKDDYYKSLQKLSGLFEFNFIDLNNGLFEESDFIDTDHLNEKGAIKLATLLNEFIMPSTHLKRNFVNA